MGAAYGHFWKLSSHKKPTSPHPVLEQRRRYGCLDRHKLLLLSSNSPIGWWGSLPANVYRSGMSRLTNARVFVPGGASVLEPAPAPNNWLAWPLRATQAQLRLFCFPYAGGSGTLFRSWRSQLPATVDVCAIQLPGRGARIRERVYGQMGTLVPAISNAILPLCDRPFAFFGHSLGALISFELARAIRRQTGPEPVTVVASR